MNLDRVRGKFIPMKKPVLLSVLFLLAFNFVKAQDFYAGLKAGVATTQVSGDELSGFDKAGLVAGGSVGLPLSKKFDLSMEILYIQKGSRKNAKPDDGDYESYLLRLNYFEIPLLLQWKFSKRFIFEAGPTFGVLLSSYEEDEFGELPPQPVEFNKTEFCLLGGMTINIVKNFAFNIRYEKSMLPIREISRDQFNEALSFAFQYTFRKDKE